MVRKQILRYQRQKGGLSDFSAEDYLSEPEEGIKELDTTQEFGVLPYQLEPEYDDEDPEVEANMQVHGDDDFRRLVGILASLYHPKRKKNSIYNPVMDCKKVEGDLAENLKMIDPLKEENEILKKDCTKLQKLNVDLSNEYQGSQKLIEQLESCISNLKEEIKQETKSAKQNDKFVKQLVTSSDKLTASKSLTTLLINYVKMSSKIMTNRMEVRNKYEVLLESQEQVQFEVTENCMIERKWEYLKTNIHHGCSTTLLKKNKTAKQPWMTEEILELMKACKQSKNSPTYHVLDKEIDGRCRKAKEHWLNSKYLMKRGSPISRLLTKVEKAMQEKKLMNYDDKLDESKQNESDEITGSKIEKFLCEGDEEKVLLCSKIDQGNRCDSQARNDSISSNSSELEDLYQDFDSNICNLQFELPTACISKKSKNPTINKQELENNLPEKNKKSDKNCGLLDPSSIGNINKLLCNSKEGVCDEQFQKGLKCTKETAKEMSSSENNKLVNEKTDESDLKLLIPFKSVKKRILPAKEKTSKSVKLNKLNENSKHVNEKMNDTNLTPTTVFASTLSSHVKSFYQDSDSDSTMNTLPFKCSSVCKSKKRKRKGLNKKESENISSKKNKKTFNENFGGFGQSSIESIGMLLSDSEKVVCNAQLSVSEGNKSTKDTVEILSLGENSKHINDKTDRSALNLVTFCDSIEKQTLPAEENNPKAVKLNEEAVKEPLLGENSHPVGGKIAETNLNLVTIVGSIEKPNLFAKENYFKGTGFNSIKLNEEITKELSHNESNTFVNDKTEESNSDPVTILDSVEKQTVPVKENNSVSVKLNEEAMKKPLLGENSHPVGGKIDETNLNVVTIVDSIEKPNLFAKENYSKETNFKSIKLNEEIAKELSHNESNTFVNDKTEESNSDPVTILDSVEKQTVPVKENNSVSVKLNEEAMKKPLLGENSHPVGGKIDETNLNVVTIVDSIEKPNLFAKENYSKETNFKSIKLNEEIAKELSHNESNTFVNDKTEESNSDPVTILDSVEKQTVPVKENNSVSVKLNEEAMKKPLLGENSHPVGGKIDETNLNVVTIVDSIEKPNLFAKENYSKETNFKSIKLNEEIAKELSHNESNKFVNDKTEESNPDPITILDSVEKQTVPVKENNYVSVKLNEEAMKKPLLGENSHPVGGKIDETNLNVVTIVDSIEKPNLFAKENYSKETNFKSIKLNEEIAKELSHNESNKFVNDKTEESNPDPITYSRFLKEPLLSKNGQPVSVKIDETNLNVVPIVDSIEKPSLFAKENYFKRTNFKSIELNEEIAKELSHNESNEFVNDKTEESNPDPITILDSVEKQTVPVKENNYVSVKLNEEAVKLSQSENGKPVSKKIDRTNSNLAYSTSKPTVLAKKKDHSLQSDKNSNGKVICKSKNNFKRVIKNSESIGSIANSQKESKFKNCKNNTTFKEDVSKTDIISTNNSLNLKFPVRNKEKSFLNAIKSKQKKSIIKASSWYSQHDVKKDVEQSETILSTQKFKKKSLTAEKILKIMKLPERYQRPISPISDFDPCTLKRNEFVQKMDVPGESINTDISELVLDSELPVFCDPGDEALFGESSDDSRPTEHSNHTVTRQSSCGFDISNVPE
ncbi:hypothetical protein GQR58_006063 [Nymphon striatum]|nr:hypothetical protein GQR58_006063 [Nymphon striatum]